MTFAQAATKAHKLSKLRNEEMFVVREAGEYHVASAICLDTFFRGISDHDILLSTYDEVQ